MERYLRAIVNFGTQEQILPVDFDGDNMLLKCVAWRNNRTDEDIHEKMLIMKGILLMGFNYPIKVAYRIVDSFDEFQQLTGKKLAEIFNIQREDDNETSL